MPLYCSQCGSEYEDKAEFCYACGALRNTALEIDRSGNFRPIDDNATVVCPSCGYSNRFDAERCVDCGAKLYGYSTAPPPKNLDARDYGILFLAMIVGVIGICGIGHLILHRYSRGLMYIVCSGIVLYVQLSTGSYFNFDFVFIRFLSFAVFLHSSMDLMRLIYYPPEPPAGKNGGQ